MRFHQLAAQIGARVLTPEQLGDPEIERVYAGDKMSDLLSQAGAKTLLVTSLTGPQLLRLAELMDVPAICLVKGASPDPVLLEAAGQKHTALMISPEGMFETCGRLYVCLGGTGDARR